MATEVTTSSTQRPPERTINWGGVVKGAVIVTGVVVAAVVGAAVVSSIAGWAMASPTFGPALAGVYSAFQTGASTIAGWLGAGAGHIMNVVAPAATTAAKATGLSGHSFSAATQASVTKAASWLGFGGVAVAAAPTALHALNTTPFTQPVDHSAAYAESAVISNSAAMTHGTIHEMTHAAHHAAEHADHHESKGSWTSKFADKMGFTSHADAVRATQAERTPISQRDTSFSSQLDADRANLEAALNQR